MNTTCKILFFASNPKDVLPLSLDEEVRLIEMKIQASGNPDALSLISAWAVRPDDLIQKLNQHKPTIVHFSGHGTDVNELVLMNDLQQATMVSTSALKSLFLTLKDNIKLVILNACYSKTQAAAIAEVIDCVIGMNSEIGDQAAIAFAASFYRAIGFGRSIKEAFDQGISSLLLEGIAEETTPELIVRDGANPASIYLVAIPKRSQEKIGPLGNKIFSDDTISRVVDELEHEHEVQKSNFIRPSYLIKALDVLFDRKTFRHESLLECTLQNWQDRLHAAYQTLVVLQCYQSNMRDYGTAEQYRLYKQLLNAVDNYCMTMATHLFKGEYNERDVKKYIGTPGFASHLPPKLSFIIEGVVLKGMNPLWDEPRKKACKVMDKLRSTIKPNSSK